MEVIFGRNSVANGERCIHCNQQESEHEFQDEKTCPLGFKSEFVHEPECPVLGCGGDCSRAIAEAERAKNAQEAKWNKIQH